MRRPLPIAMMFSVTVHAIALAIAIWLIRDTASSTAPVYLVVKLKQPVARPDSSADTMSSSESEDPEPLETENQPTEPDGDPINPAQQLSPAQVPAPSRPVAAVPVEEVRVARFELAAPSPKTESTADQVAVTPQQERTLTQKLEEWTDAAFQSSQNESHLVWKHEGQEYVAKLTHADVLEDTEIPRMVVQISTTEGDSRLTTKVHLKKLAFSNYAQFVNRWDPNVYLRDDQFDGRFHSNSEINLAYDNNVSPQFFGKVTTSERRINIDSDRLIPDPNKVFLGGLETGVRSIRWPKEAFKMPEGRFADHQIHRFDANTRITFNSDGSYSWEIFGPESTEKHAGYLKDTSYLIAEKNAALHIRGTVHGQALVYSPKRIVIEGDLTYSRDPVRYSDSDDFLGLVSDKNIEIAPTTVTGPGDLVINAAMYARKQFTVRSHGSNANASLLIVGSLTAGSISATEPRYKTRIIFDKRLENHRPPGFPMTNRYVVEFWDSDWQMEPIQAAH